MYGSGQVAGIATASSGRDGEIKNCYNLSNIEMKDDKRALLSGITTDSSKNVENCYNSGTLEATATCVTGIGGANNNNCYNTGNITSIKGLASGIGTSLATNCYNSGNISAGAAVAYGITQSNATNCYNTGDVTGGTAEEICGGTLTNCAYLIKSTNAQANGAVGKTEAEMKEIMDLQKFVDLMNQKVEENNSDASNTKWKKWKLANGVPVFAE